ncbi:MAG TPA: hypothetical protein VGK32_19540 [Vicinamibacterales bacterium]
MSHPTCSHGPSESGAHSHAHMAGPPELFEVVVTALAQNGLAANARLVIEKPFGRDRVGAGGPWLNPQPPIAR